MRNRDLRCFQPAVVEQVRGALLAFGEIRAWSPGAQHSLRMTVLGSLTYAAHIRSDVAPELSLAEQRIVDRFEASSWDSANDDGMSREELAYALSQTADLLHRIWRGEIVGPSAEVGAVLTAYAHHPSHFLGGVTTDPPRPTAASVLRCEHGLTVREHCAACADPAYDSACPICAALPGYGCVSIGADRAPVPMHPARRPVSAGGQDSAEPRCPNGHDAEVRLDARGLSYCQRCLATCAPERAGVLATPANDSAQP